MNEAVIVSAVRTPFGTFGGALKDYQATDLGAHAIKSAIERIHLNPEQIDEVIMGMVISAGTGQVPARQAAIKAGIPDFVPALTINKVCSSSLKAVVLAAQLIRGGYGDVFVAGGMESMSNAPYLSSQTRWGNKSGDVLLKDSLLSDGLICPANNVHMAVLGNQVAKEYGISRESQDRWAFRSQQRWQAAEKAGVFDNERIPIQLRNKKGYVEFNKDESPRPETTMEALFRLKPVFDPNGSITAGNAPGINDGAAVAIVMSRENADQLDLKPLARIVSHAQVSQDARYIATVPGLAIQKLLKQTGMSLEQIDLFEINEAFAAVPLVSCLKILGMDEDTMDQKINVNGSSIAVGHPIGATGARILMTLIYELRRRNMKTGIAAICSGMAQGDAVLIRVDN